VLKSNVHIADTTGSWHYDNYDDYNYYYYDDYDDSELTGTTASTDRPSTPGKCLQQFCVTMITRNVGQSQT